MGSSGDNHLTGKTNGVSKASVSVCECSPVYRSLLGAYLEQSVEDLNTKQALQPTVTQPETAQLMSED